VDDKSRFLKKAHAFAHRRAVDAELLCKTSFARYSIAGPNAAIQNGVADRVDDEPISR